MKKIYMLFFAALFTAGASAQYIAQPAAVSRTAPIQRVADEATDANAGVRNTIWTNTFSDCSEWEIDNAYNNGFTQFVEGLHWVCGVGLAPSGPAAIAAINSTTAADGFMMVDSDEFGGEEGGSEIENCWFQNVDPIDCSAFDFISVRFENQYYNWDGGSDDNNEFCLVEVSHDGVTWPSIDTWEVADGFVDYGDGDVQARWEVFPEVGTQDPVANPTVKVFDITSVAGGQETVYLRFRWKGTWGYAWMVDDLEVFETLDNDVSIESYASYTNVDGSGMYDYGVWPFSQLTEMEMAARVRNVGINEAQNVVLNITVNGEDAAMTSMPINIPYASTDTVIATGYTPPAVEGLYEVGFEVTFDAEDENPIDNVDSDSFIISEFLYGRDNDMSVGGPYPAATYTGEFQYANGFQFFEPTTIYAIDVVIAAGANEAPIQGHVLDANLDIVASTEELELNPELINTSLTGDLVWTTLRLEDPFTVPANTLFLASVESFGGSGVRVARSKPSPAQTVFVYGDFGSAGFDWYFTSSTGMVRFNLNPDAQTNVEEVAKGGNFTLFQNIPNPANATTRIRYNLNNSDRVSFEVMDLTGKRVKAQDLGMQVMGEHQFDLNISDLAPGLYTYTLTVGNERATRKMIVQ